jgi:hypothetical protein
VRPSESTRPYTPITVPPVDEDPAIPEAGQHPQRSLARNLITLRWMRSWQFVLLATVGMVAGAMTFALVSLFRIPNLPNCRAIFWPTASASLRLQCAESYAQQDTVDFLLEAIDLVDHLPADHPLRNEINANIEDWSRRILDLADESFHQGELDSAIATARKIPPHTAAADLVESRIRQWQRIWQEGSDIYESAKTELSQRKFKEAFSLSVKLLDVENDYWQTTKYSELTQLIALAREDSAKISKAESLGKQGTVDGFKEALKILNSIEEESILYGEAQQAKKTLAKDMLQVAETALERQSLSQAERILKEIPRNAGFNAEIADFQIFIDAYQRAWSGDALGLDAAINRLQSLGSDRPLYNRAQQLISRWRSELQALALLDQARQIAAGGSIEDLKAAIAEAQKISRSNPRWDETAQQIRRWRERVETVEDQPFLVRAEELANPGTPAALQAAIQEARKVGSGRALSDQAQTRINAWTRRLQQIEDQPLLDQARRQAAGGDLAGAIATASRIQSGRALYDEAQADLTGWRNQNQARLWLQEAQQSAATGTGTGYASAIRTARQIPQSSGNYTEATGLINRWSWSLLTQAESIASANISQAITLAEQIPSQAEAYAAAQTRIRDWQTQQQQRQNSLELTPAPDETTPSASPTPTTAPAPDPSSDNP